MQTRAAACPELFTRLYETVWMVAEALYSIDTEPPVSEHDGQSTELTLVESCAD